jgi:DNA helicase II / ATP-dependent DNA helicase PcrA
MMMPTFTPRPKQQAVLSYRSGRMGVSAVPGSGKTHTLSYLAAQIIARGELDDDQEVLIVTLVNSAVENFDRKVTEFTTGAGLLPRLGYRVRTLHGLAHDIVRERPGLVGLDGDFQILDERVASQICSEAGRAWLRSHPYDLDDYLNPDLEEGKRDWVRRDQLPDLVNNLAANFIRYAKDSQITPDRLLGRLDELAVPLPLARMGAEIYSDYQRALAYRGAVDFDDLIRLALLALELDQSYLERLNYRWPYILEDEAQDSSRLQEQILRRLAGPNGNWVRVGDPNQAIYETFTTASPQFLIDFVVDAGVESRDLPNSGRSTRSIISLANFLIDWTREQHPVEAVRRALAPPHIETTPLNDPQPNPPDNPDRIYLMPNRFTPHEEILAVAGSLERWLPDHQDMTVAVLAPRNTRGFELAAELERRKIPYIEILRSTNSTRMAAGALGNVLSYLADPQSAARLSRLYHVWRRHDRDDPEGHTRVERIGNLLKRCRRVEDYLWPRLDNDWLSTLPVEGPQKEETLRELDDFRDLVRRWQGAATLPIDQIVLTLAQDLFTQPGELALAHKLALVLRQAGDANASWRLPELTEELASVARNERRFLGFSEDDSGFNPEKYKGKVLIATLHKAKGLEWDRVYLMSANNYDFPSAQPNDSYISERWYLRDSLNLEAEAMQQLEAAFSQDPYAWYQEGLATRESRLEYVSERLRLFYVGLTRARRELIVTWNTGQRGDCRPALAYQALRSFWEQQTGSTPDP